MTKYHSHKAQCKQGHLHDSKAEARRCNELYLLKAAGEISGIQVQKRFELLPAIKYEGQPNERRIDYIADFVYTENGKVIVEDVKGKKTKDYIIKRKLFKAKYCKDNDRIKFKETK